MSLSFVWMDFHFRVSNCEREFCQYFSIIERLGCWIYAYSSDLNCALYMFLDSDGGWEVEKKNFRKNKIKFLSAGWCKLYVVLEMENIRKMAFVCGGLLHIATFSFLFYFFRYLRRYRNTLRKELIYWHVKGEWIDLFTSDIVVRRGSKAGIDDFRFFFIYFLLAKMKSICFHE